MELPSVAAFAQKSFDAPPFLYHSLCNKKLFKCNLFEGWCHVRSISESNENCQQQVSLRGV